MAYPFGGHPTLHRFVEAAEAQGCSASIYSRTASSGQAYNVLRIDNPVSGCGVLIVNPDFSEHLSPSTVTYYQRRLGIKTSFAAQPGSPSDDDPSLVDPIGPQSS
jgi:hypothetical protein